MVRPSTAQKFLIDFCIVSSDLFSEVLDVRVKRGAELSTDHHLVVCSLQYSKPWLNRKSHISPMWLTRSNGSPWRAEM